MPGYNGHITFSVLLSLGIFLLFSLLHSIYDLSIFSPILGTIGGNFFLFITVMAFGLLPDIDTNSLGQFLFYSLFLIIDICLIFLGEYKLSAYFGLIALFPIISKHRGWTHSRISAIVLPMLLFIVPSIVSKELLWDIMPFSIAGSISYLGHLLIDGELFRKRKA